MLSHIVHRVLQSFGVLAVMSIAVLLGIPLGLWAGLKPRSAAGKAIMAGSILGFSLPTFWVGLMLIMVFSVWLGWLPTSGRGPTVNLIGIPVSFLSLDGLRHLVLPAANLALFNLSLLIRLARSGTREAMQQDYVRFARAKGLTETGIVGYLCIVVALFVAINLFVDLLYSWLDPRIRLEETR